MAEAWLVNVPRLSGNFGSFSGNGLNRHPGYMGLTLAPNIISQHRRFIINFGILSIASNFMNYSAALLLFSTAFLLLLWIVFITRWRIDVHASWTWTRPLIISPIQGGRKRKVTRSVACWFVLYFNSRWSTQVFKMPTRLHEKPSGRNFNCFHSQLNNVLFCWFYNFPKNKFLDELPSLRFFNELCWNFTQTTPGTWTARKNLRKQKLFDFSEAFRTITYSGTRFFIFDDKESFVRVFERKDPNLVLLAYILVKK